MIDQITIDRILDAAQIMDVDFGFCHPAQTWCQIMSVYVRSTVIKPLLFMSLPLKDYANASPVAKVEMLSISLWNTSRCLIRKH